MTEVEINQQVADEICNAARWNGKEYHTGDCLALLDGKVVAVVRDLDAALRALRALDPDPRRGMLVEVAPRVTDVIR